MATKPFVTDSTHIYPYAGGGGGSGTGGGGGALYVGPLSANPDPYVYGQWIVTGNTGPWAGPIASGVFTLMISNGTTWFPISTGSGGGGGSGLPEIYVVASEPGSTGGALLWLDTDSGPALRAAAAMAPPGPAVELSKNWADTFDRADAEGHAEVGNGWTADPRMLGDMDIVDQSLRLDPGLGIGYQRYYTFAPTAAPFTGDIAVEVDWPSSNIDFGTGLMCRFDPFTTQGVRCWLTGPDSVELGDATWWNAGNVPLVTVNDFPSSWGMADVNTLRLELRGDDAHIYANGVLVRTGKIDVNADIADGAVGFCGEAIGRVVHAIRVTSL